MYLFPGWTPQSYGFPFAFPFTPSNLRARYVQTITKRLADAKEPLTLVDGWKLWWGGNAPDVEGDQRLACLLFDARFLSFGGGEAQLWGWGFFGCCSLLFIAIAVAVIVVVVAAAAAVAVVVVVVVVGGGGWCWWWWLVVVVVVGVGGDGCCCCLVLLFACLCVCLIVCLIV